MLLSVVACPNLCSLTNLSITKYQATASPSVLGTNCSYLEIVSSIAWAGIDKHYEWNCCRTKVAYLQNRKEEETKKISYKP